MRRTFRDSKLQEEFEEMGYVMVPFLSEEEVTALRDQYFSLQHDLGEGFHATMHSHIPEYRRKVSHQISDVFTPKADKLLDTYTHLVSNYTVKEVGENSFFDLHLDWNMLDEKQAHSVTIWCPLEDVNAENGNLWVLDKSHTLGETYRCGPGLFLYYSDVLPEEEARFTKKALEIKAGTAVIYTHKLWHGSPPNLSNKVRLAINQAMRPKEIPSYHYCELNDNEIGIYAVDDDFYHRCIIGETPKDVPLVDKFPKPSERILQDTINKMIANETIFQG